jgi:hypothetical protein
MKVKCQRRDHITLAHGEKLVAPISGANWIGDSISHMVGLNVMLKRNISAPARGRAPPVTQSVLHPTLPLFNPVSLKRRVAENNDKYLETFPLERKTRRNCFEN